MATGLANKLTGQIGEYLACAELGRKGLIATSFTGNVPEYDLLVCDSQLNTLPVQIKTSRGTSWPSRANKWLDIEIDDVNRKQINHGEIDISFPELIYISIALGAEQSSDRFFICTKRQIQQAFIKSYCDWMDPNDWKRPRNYKSFDNRCQIKHIENYENNWQLIFDRLEGQN